MNEVPLTREQREFATKWHNLIYTFLNEKRLPEEDYYDIVVFGFLRAVKEYLSKPALQRYSFSTIAWNNMRSVFPVILRANLAKSAMAIQLAFTRSHMGASLFNWRRPYPPRIK
jgi:hypothetical protein